jgi:hypothetical protein
VLSGLLSVCIASRAGSDLFVGVAQAQVSKKTTAGNKTAPADSFGNKTAPADSFLAVIASIPEWASKLDMALEKQGASIDGRKARQKLIPDVTAIQKDLSDLEDLHKQLIDELNRSSADKNAVENILVEIAFSIKSMSMSFKNIRSQIQTLSIPKLVDLERAAEDAIAAKGREVESMREALGYPTPKPFGSDPSHVDLKARSNELKDLLRTAQNAFIKLHQTLEK